MCGNDCLAKKSVHPNRVIGLWSGLLLLLVPKCPFCFVAFSGVMVFCGEKGLVHNIHTFYSSTTLILTAIFCITALLSFILYYRPEKSRYALLMVLPGVAALMYSVTAGGGMLLYYSGAWLVLAGLLRNSGLWFYVGKMILTKKPAY
jgi:hypothetical protein